MNEKGLEKLEELIVSNAKILRVGEAQKLKQAVENKNSGYTTGEKNTAQLLVSAGLLMFSGKSEGLRSTEYHYDSTPKGIKFYDLIFKS